MMKRQSQLFRDWANAVIQMAENLPSADAPTREAWRRQAKTAVAALEAHEQMMTQIRQTITAAARSDKTAMEPLFAATAPIMNEFMKTWGPHLHAMQDLVANWTARTYKQSRPLMSKGPKGRKSPAAAPTPPPKPSKAGTTRAALPAPAIDPGKKERTKSPPSPTFLEHPGSVGEMHL
jgi:hypothetical protein